jgi:hypothetical protein
MASERVTVVLKTADDWDEWVEVIKSAAIGLEVWDLINPNKTTVDLRRNERPQRPRPSDVKEGATGITGLNEDEKDEYKFLKKEYERELTKHETYKTGLGKIRTKIQESVSRSNLQYTFRKDTPYHMLVALKDRYAPSDTTRIRELKVKYEKLKSSTPKRESLDDWLQRWEVTFTECLDYKISDVQENGAVWDFVRATEKINSDFAAIWTDKLLDMDSNFPDLYAIIKKFRNFKRERDTHMRERADLSFATFKGQSDLTSSTAAENKESRDDRNKDNDTPKRRKCFCDQEHLWRDCPYVNESKRSSGWKPDKEIQERLERMLETNMRLKSVVESVQKKKHEDKDKKEDDPEGERIRVSMHTRGESCLSTEASVLRDSFLLDSASDSHVSNNRDRFTDMRPAPADATLKSGGGGIKILGYGTVVIRPEPVSLGGDVELTLNEVAYAPDFPVNLVSYDIAISKQIFWDAEKGVLTKNGKDLCKVNRIHRQWLLEYNPISSFATFGQPSKDTSGQETILTPREQITVEVPDHTPEKNIVGSQDSEDSDSETETDTDLPENPTPHVTEVAAGGEINATDLTEIQQQLPTPEDTPERNFTDAPESVEEQLPPQAESAGAVYQPNYIESSPCHVQPGFILRPLEPLYGLQMSPKIRYIHVSETLKELGLSTSALEDICVFTTNQHLIVFFFVDDAVLTFYEEFRKACQLDSGIKRMSRRSHHKGTEPFDHVYYDLIQMKEAYNGDQWITRLVDETSYTQSNYTHRYRNDTLGCLQHFKNYAKNRYGRDIVIIHLDGKRTSATYFNNYTRIPTSQMPADGLTKPPTSQNHEKFVKMLNLQCIKGLISGEG